MSSILENKDQNHPQEKSDRAIVDSLLKIKADPTDYQLTELARLRIRYSRFPGAREIQQGLERILQQWNLTEEELFELTRQIHSQGQVYKQPQSVDSQDDWT
ncbi:DUF3288 family protein [Coleofasciculus sp. G2-EDA-02]|uniref:DUF3288 family protein n=1 Tax=Coleofasciculus sp. G2-EDA-02 TaxID=3069529 RepID=UPI0033043E8D